MRYFLDCEFVEDGVTIDLISIGLVTDDGREFYAVNRDCKIQFAGEWVWENVLKPMGVYSVVDWVTNPGDPSIHPRLRETLKVMRSRDDIASLLKYFVDEDHPEFWGEWPSYDWVALCQCFGTMMDLPKHFPMRCDDVIQLAEHCGFTTDDLPESLEVDGNHHALLGAKSVKTRYDWLRSGDVANN